jgi:hypothetical protein
LRIIIGFDKRGKLCIAKGGLLVYLFLFFYTTALFCLRLRLCCDTDF